MHLLDFLQKLLKWTFDHSDKLFYVAKTFVLVRNELTKKPKKAEEKAIPLTNGKWLFCKDTVIRVPALVIEIVACRFQPVSHTLIIYLHETYGEYLLLPKMP